MAVNPSIFEVTAKNAGAVWSAMAAYSLEADPRYAELERKLGVNAAKSVVITAAGNFWNADLAFSTDRLKQTPIPLDESRETAARLSVYKAVESVAVRAGLGTVPSVVSLTASTAASAASSAPRWVAI